jgi:Holliday junction resolvase RusA-like endonuclease
MAGDIRIEIPGAPVAKGRPKLTTRGGFARAYTPAKTRRYEDLLRLRAGEVMNGREPIAGPVTVFLVAHVPIPKSLNKAKREAAERGILKPTTRPDLDNYTKCLDGLNGIVWNDDSQITGIAAFKMYSDRPRLEVTISSSEEGA